MPGLGITDGWIPALFLINLIKNMMNFYFNVLPEGNMAESEWQRKAPNIKASACVCEHGHVYHIYIYK